MQLIVLVYQLKYISMYGSHPCSKFPNSTCKQWTRITCNTGITYTRAYLSPPSQGLSPFLSMRQQAVLRLPLDGLLVHHKVPPPQAFHHAFLTVNQYPFICTPQGAWREALKLKEHNTLTPPTLASGPLDTESSAGH